MACRGFRRAVSTAALSVLAAASAAQASDWNFGEPRYVSSEGATSECIGKLISARCAVESFLACHARADIDLCQKVTRRPREFFAGFLHRTESDIRFDYQLESFGRKRISDGQFEYQIELNECNSHSGYTSPYFIHTYIALRDDKGWWVQSWWSEDPD
jgi:hypothetical protein